jgi:integrase
MSSLQKTATGWRAQVYKRGVRDSQMFRTKEAARAWAAARETELLAEAGIGAPPKKTLADALRRYAKEVAPLHKGSRWELIRLAAMERTIPCANRLLADIRQPDLAAWRDSRLAVVTPSSVSREWSLLTQVLTIAISEWKWIKESPLQGVRRPVVDDERDRRISPLEVRAICRALGWMSRRPVLKKQFVALAFLVSLRTAMRSGEILGLRGQDIDLQRRVARLYDTKNGDDRDVPLSKAAARLLGLVSGLPVPFQMSDAVRDTLFRRAVMECGIEDLRFHDARAEALTRLSLKLNVFQLARLSGHRDTRVLFTRYYREDMSEVAKLL